MAQNLLEHETSPYLLQHKDNPVHWRAWGPEALQEARDTGRPILLSVGYAACHWCHVMAHESFEDPGIAALMNDKFVNIKVDREERPDIDAIYQTALALLGQQGGWPLTMFLTPEGEPFWGGTYFPPESKWGRPGFPEVLERVEAVFHNEKDLVEKNRAALTERLDELSRAGGDGTSLRGDSIEQIAEAMVRQVDFEQGGLQGAPKFPSPSIFLVFWRAWQKTGVEAYRRAVTTTLERMSEGGIYDHLGGGYARYSVDPMWLVPHFEKMLYDNAQILDLLRLAWAETGDPLFEQRIIETIGWIEREMIAENGAFAATLDADSEGEEGKFYVWSEDEIRGILGEGEATDRFCDVYGVTEAGNWEGKTILNRLHLREKPDPDQEAQLADQRQILFAERERRIHPGWDDKVLADWNGLMIAALASCAAAFARPLWLDLAIGAYRAVKRDLGYDDGKGHARLYHSFRQGQARHMGLLDDYADMSRAALILHELTGEAGYLGDAKAWTATLDALFWDSEAGGYFFSAEDAEALIVRTKTATDNAVPAGNGVMVEVLARLYMLTGEEGLRVRAEQLVGAFAARAAQQAPAFATLINGFDTLVAGRQIVLVGERSDDATGKMIRTVTRSSLPDATLQVVGGDEDLPEHHPARGKGQQDGRPTAYVCVGQSCSLPVTSAEDLEALLREQR